jgi:hypothetical protein
MKSQLLSTLFAATALASTGAGAVTIDFESLTRGQVITTQLQSQGVLVSGINTTGCCNPGTVLDVALGDMGVFNFGGSGRQALVYGVAGDQLNFDFVLPNTTTATTWDTVSLRVGDGDAAPEKWRVTFKGLAGNVLSFQDVITTSGAVGGGATVSYSGAGVHRVEVLGLVYSSGGGVDDLTFGNTAPIPEPGTWALMAAGLALVGFGARRRSA